MKPRFEIIAGKKLIGKCLKMNLMQNRTPELWRSLMPKRKEINAVSTDLYSLQVYDITYFDNFIPEKEFEKWALIEVENFDNIPLEMTKFELKAGQYAVFNHKGDSEAFLKLTQHIYGVWLPNSSFVLDDRPHFEILGEKYKNGNPDSEEEVWIPIKTK